MSLRQDVRFLQVDQRLLEAQIDTLRASLDVSNTLRDLQSEEIARLREALRATQVYCEARELSAGDLVSFVEGEGQAWEHHIPAVVDTVDGDLATVTLNHGFPHQRIVRIEELELRVPDA